LAGAALVLLLSVSINSLAASPGDVVVNEIAWMGMQASTSDEWIELKNNTEQDIDLSGWTLKATDDAPSISLTGVISADGFYLLERTDDSTVSDIAADRIYTGALENTGEHLLLKDDSGDPIDNVNAGGGWFAGSTTPHYASMERVDPRQPGISSNWATNDPSIASNGLDAGENSINGTPRARNSATNSPPVADAGPDQVVQTGDTVQLDGSASSDSDGDSLSRAWSFTAKPTGSTAALSDQTVVDPTFVADTAGDCGLELAVKDGYGGRDTDQVTITVHAPPSANFRYSPDQPTTWDTVQFTDQSSDSDGTLVAWSWSFGDGVSSSEQNPSHRYGLPGAYPVALEVTDNDGLVSLAAREITILLGPGDIDGNATINLLDVRLCLQIAAGFLEGTAAQRTAADGNEDGDVDLADAQLLAKYVIGWVDKLGGD